MITRIEAKNAKSAHHPIALPQRPAAGGNAASFQFGQMIPRYHFSNRKSVLISWTTFSLPLSFPVRRTAGPPGAARSAELAFSRSSSLLPDIWALQQWFSPNPRVFVPRSFAAVPRCAIEARSTGLSVQAGAARKPVWDRLGCDVTQGMEGKGGRSPFKW
jgi:hypothetical protein